MLRAFALTVLSAWLAGSAAAARADVLELSGFGGYTALAMKQVNAMLADPKSQPGVNQTTTTDLSGGYLVGVDVRSGALIPLPFLELGLKGEYIGTDSPGVAAGTVAGQAYRVQEDPSLVAAMVGLDFDIAIPATGLNLGVSAYGGYGEGVMQQSVASGGAVPLVSDYYHGGGFVGEAEARLGYKLYGPLSLYAFGGYRWAGLGAFSDPAGAKLGFDINNAAPPDVDFSGVTGGLGLNIDL